MDKSAIVAALRARLQEELQVIQASAAAAREGATHEEAKPENEYDTRGLEQSYLAGAQAARAEALVVAIEGLDSFRPRSFEQPDAQVQVGACVQVDDGESTRCYFLSPVGGGTKLHVDGRIWWVLSPSSPLGRLLLGKRAGDAVEHLVRGESVELELVEVS